MTKDPVCYREIEEQLASKEGLFSNREGQLFYFCSADCKARFDKDPDAYSMRVSEWQQAAEAPVTENFIG